MQSKLVKKISKFLIVFLTIAGVSFSNIPYFALIGIIDSFVKGRNIVDKGWHLSQNSNIVDTFTSSRAFIEKLKVYEAQAATLTYVGGTSCTGTGATYSCTLNSGLTGGIASAAAAGDLVIVVTGWASTANGDPGVSTPTGYTEVYDLAANDTRDAQLSVNWKIMGGTPDTSVTVRGFNNAANGGATAVHVWRGADQTTPMDVTPPTGVTTNNSALPDSPAITPVTTGAVVLTVGLGTGDASPLTQTAPAGYGNARSVAGTGSTMSTIANIASIAWAGGAVDPAAWGLGESTGSDSRAAGTLALRPANDPPTLTVTQPDGVGDAVTVGAAFDVIYSLADPDNVVTAAFYYDTNSDGVGGTAITGACATAAEGPGVACSWDTTGMTLGSYWVYGITNDGVNPAVTGISTGVITINAPPNALTVTTSGSQIGNLNSGASDQHIGGGATAAFQLRMSDSAVNVNSVMLTDTGTITLSDLTSQRLYYETAATCTYNGIESNVSGTPVGETVTFSLTSVQAPVSPNYLCLYYVFNLDSTNAVGGETIDITIANPSTDVVLASGQNTDTVAKPLSVTTTVLPNVTSFSNSTEPALTDGARETQTISIAGAGFGTTCNGTTSKVEIGTYALSCTGATFSSTSISIPVDSGLPDTNDGGTGANGLLVTIGSSADDTQQTFYAYPTVSSITDDFSGGFDIAREYAAGDDAALNTTSDMKDGEIQINGIHFGSSGTVTILGQTATQAVIGTRCSSTAYTATCITVQVPASIGDGAGGASDYVGSVAVDRGASKSHSLSGFRVLPRITGFTPTSGVEGASVTVDGNHFCQDAPTCPSAFGAAYRVTFTSAVEATTFTSWAYNAMATTVPAGAVTGNVVLKSNTFDSNGSSFTVLVPTPTTPTSLQQSRNSGFTNLIPLTVPPSHASSTPVYFSMQTTSGVTGGTMYMQTEMRPVGANSCPGPVDCFTNVCTGNPYCFEGTGVGPYGGGTVTTTSSTSSADALWHWQTRTRYNLSGTDHYSSWQCYPNSGCNAESAGDFELDTIAPAISSLTATGITANAATITWNTTGDSSSTQLAYGTDSILVTGTATTTEADTSPTVTAHSVSISNLSCGITYYYRARSRDDAGIITFSAIQNFTTSACPSSPAKTAVFHITGQTGSVTNGSPLNQAFTVHIPETASSTRSAFVEITGIYETSAASITIAIQHNSEPTRTYTLPGPSSGTLRSHFRLVHRANTVNASNTLTLTPTSATVYVNSARMIVTYDYTP